MTRALVDLFYESNTLHFLLVSPEKGGALLQPLWIIHNARAGIAAIAHPTAERPGVVAMVKKDLGSLTTALTKTVLRLRRTVFLFGWG